MIAHMIVGRKLNAQLVRCGGHLCCCRFRASEGINQQLCSSPALQTKVVVFGLRAVKGMKLKNCF